MQNLIDHFALFNQMSAIKRFSRDRMAKQENVLEHTGFVVLFCLFVARGLEETGERPFDLGRLLEKAAVHDLDEPVLGDVPRPTKYMSSVASNEFRMAEERAVEGIEEYFSISLLESWTHAKDDTPEGRLVAIADLAAVVAATWTEVCLYGNKSFLRVGKELLEVLSRMKNNSARFFWEQQIVEELWRIVHDIRYEDSGHPQLRTLLKLDEMIKEANDNATKDSREVGENEIPF